MKIFSLTFLIFGFATSLLSAQITIDTFETDSQLIPLAITTVTQTTSGPGILGGERDETLTTTSVTNSLAANNGNLNIQQGATDQISGSVLYDNFANIDLTSATAGTLFSVEFVSSDTATPLTDVLSISLSSRGISATSFVTVPTTNNLGVATVDFASFTGIDLTSVDSISLNFDFASAPGNDFSITTFGTTAVPEPSGIGLCCLAVGGIFLRRRRNA